MLRLGAFDAHAGAGSRPGRGGVRGSDPACSSGPQTFQIGDFGDILVNLFDSVGQSGRPGADLQDDIATLFERTTL